MALIDPPMTMAWRLCRASMAADVIVAGPSLARIDPPYRRLRPRRERPRGRRATSNGDEVPPPHGAYPKAKDHGLSIAGLGVASVACIAQKRKKVCLSLTAEPLSQSDVL